MARLCTPVRLRTHAALVAVLVIALALKIALLAADVLPFNSDEAVVALMARHILQGERPVFFYGQAYLGSLDAWLVAAAFAVLGESVTAIRVVQIILYLGTIITGWWLARLIYGTGWIANTAALLLAVPTVTVTLYTTVSIGGYGEILLIGNLLMLLALRLGGSDERWWHWASFGLLGGLGFWGFGLALVYFLPSLAYVVVRRVIARRLQPSSFFLLPSFALGAWPWISFTLNNGLASLTELGGSAIAGASPGGFFVESGRHALNFAALGLTAIFGLRPSWSANLLALPLAPVALTVQIGVVAYMIRRLIADGGWQTGSGGRWSVVGGRLLLAAVCLTLIAAFILTPFGADPSGRYFLPLAVPLALFTAEMLNRVRRDYRRLALAGALGLIAFNSWGTLQSALAFPPGLTTQFDPVTQIDRRYDPALIRFLLDEGEMRGYSNYWVEFPIAFLSGERLLFSARLPYHEDFRYTPRDDRYGPYTRAVAESERAAYVTSKHPALNEKLRDRLKALGVEFGELEIGDYHVFYRLSRKVVPEELGLGVECCPG